ncbi:hypothetical protein BDW74DRAFT_156192 [Aspergillus multicolor]|uniref:uncharacterized protein n=1 Tax=Aspergillus multicolor TaxID=41759 RepID=UPI003CCCCC5A
MRVGVAIAWLSVTSAVQPWRNRYNGESHPYVLYSPLCALHGQCLCLDALVLQALVSAPLRVMQRLVYARGTPRR